jgi:hypothetical protein
MYAPCLVLLVLALPLPQQSNPIPDEPSRILQQATSAREEARRQAIHLNELAGKIRSEADARIVVDAVAKMFEKELPPAWTLRSVRKRVARAEYAAVLDPSHLIPEQRIADVWNEYVREVGAPDEALVTVAQLHNIRDAHYAASQFFWTRDINRTIWTIPNVSAIGSDGKVADGCRALEAVRLIFDMDNNFENVRRARERVQKGVIVSDEIKKRLESPPQGERTMTSASLQVSTITNPLHPAEQRYIRDHSFAAFNQLLERLYNRLFPE